MNRLTGGAVRLDPSVRAQHLTPRMLRLVMEEGIAAHPVLGGSRRTRLLRPASAKRSTGWPAHRGAFSHRGPRGGATAAHCSPLSRRQEVGRGSSARVTVL